MGSNLSKRDKSRKLFTKTYMTNEKTGRMNQLLQCSLCPSSFTKLCNALDHARMHIDYRPFTCSTCGLTFAQKGNLKRHVKSAYCENKPRIRQTLKKQSRKQSA